MASDHYRLQRARNDDSDNDSDESDCGVPLSLASTNQYVPDDCVWLGTDDNRVLIFETEEDAKRKSPRATINLDAPVLCILVHEGHVIISIGTTESSAALCIFSRVSAGWKIDEWTTFSVAKDLCDRERKDEFLPMLSCGFSKMIFVEGKFYHKKFVQIFKALVDLKTKSGQHRGQIFSFSTQKIIIK